MAGILRLVMVGLALFAVVLFYSGGSAWRKRNRVSALITLLGGALLLTVSTLCAAITVGIRGYRAFTAEALAATIKTDPIGPHHFRATVTLPDSSLHMFDLAADAVYVDAHVSKWRPIGTFLALQPVSARCWSDGSPGSSCRGRRGTSSTRSSVRNASTCLVSSPPRWGWRPSCRR